MQRDDGIHPWRIVVAALLIGAAAWLAYRSADTLDGTIGEASPGMGYVPNPEGTRRFLAELAEPTFGEAGQEAIEKAEGRDTFLHRHVQKAHQKHYGTPWKCWDQGEHGSCVSFAFALGSYTGQAVDWTTGRMPQPPPQVATEPIYGGSRTAARVPPQDRNYGGDGSYGGAAARWISGKCKDQTIGGILYRQPYGSYDLSTYSIPRSRDWGRNGVPADLAKLAAQHRAVAVAQVNNWQELCAAVERGSPVVLCSTVGYGRWDGRMPVRDEHGFLERGKSWAHAMLCWGVRHAANGSPQDGGLIQNSWSERWCSGPKWPEDQPDGSFWARKKDIEAALSQGDSFAIGGVDGFAWREINHVDFYEPADEGREP